jgi:hypothetical protein
MSVGVRNDHSWAPTALLHTRDRGGVVQDKYGTNLDGQVDDPEIAAKYPIHRLDKP